ncbi:MAG: hypothetical protein AAGD10_14165 [Myxococcota bacterium]
MKEAAARSESWCMSWDELSDELLEQLRRELNIERVHELLQGRQRLMTANPRPSEGRGQAELRTWLEAARDREDAIRDAFESYRARVRAARRSMLASQATRRRFGSQDQVLPASRLDRRV